MQAAVKAGAKALLVTHMPDVRYLCGFTGSNGALVLGAGKATLYTDGRYTAQAKAEAVGTRVVIAQRSAGRWRCARRGGGGRDAVRVRCGADDRGGAGGDARGGAGERAAALFVPVGPVVAELREVKDEDEIGVIRRAAGLGCRLFETMLGSIRSGMTEVAVAAELEHAARLAGAERMSFDTIVASGERSALPHGRATLAKLPARAL